MEQNRMGKKKKSITDPLIIGGVIGDVVDLFEPTVIMSVFYGTKQVTNGCNIKPSAAADAPLVTFTGHRDQLYTLVMTDPDAPSPSEPSMREFVHWIVTDIPGCGNVTLGKEILGYMGPCPLLGIHRYTIILFQQRAPLGLIEPPISFTHFNTRAFAEWNGLGVKVAAVYFNAQKELTNKRRS